MSTTWPCCSIELIESFLFWVILITYNIGISMCAYIHKVSYFILFVIFSCNVFSALHAKHVMWYVCVFIGNPFPLSMEYFCLKKTVLSMVSLSLACQSAKILLVNLLWRLSWNFFILLEWHCQFLLVNLIQLNDCWGAGDKLIFLKW